MDKTPGIRPRPTLWRQLDAASRAAFPASCTALMLLATSFPLGIPRPGGVAACRGSGLRVLLVAVPANLHAARRCVWDRPVGGPARPVADRRQRACPAGGARVCGAVAPVLGAAGFPAGVAGVPGRGRRRGAAAMGAHLRADGAIVLAGSGPCSNGLSRPGCIPSWPCCSPARIAAWPTRSRHEERKQDHRRVHPACPAGGGGAGGGGRGARRAGCTRCRCRRVAAMPPWRKATGSAPG